ncbi:MAG: IS66 family transposase [Bernardetiaceae bacterium]|nr:IS66 family transposase [Bernardetiaceae bacterium]
MVDTPDEVVVHHHTHCSCCNRKFSSQDAFEKLKTRRQVWDIPIPKIRVIEHQLAGIKCCGHIHKGAFPEQVSASIQYGTRINTLVSMLNVDFCMPYGKISQLMTDLFGVRMNESTITQANERLYKNLALVEKQIKLALQATDVAHFDETGMRIAGKTRWFHTASNDSYCYLFAHEKRGGEALESAYSVLSNFKGYAVHDCWASYFKFDNAKHALCNAHILQELKGLIENSSHWAKEMNQFLLDLYLAAQKGKLVVKNFKK